jgi:hypothetical protein
MAMTVWPTDQAPGNVSSEPAWRKMAKLWAPSGVVARTLNEMNPTLVGGPAIRVDTGAVWIDGHYAENPVAATIASVGDGLLVCRFDPATGTAELVYRPGVTTPTQTVATWEVPIAQILAGALVDRRAFASVEGDLGYVEVAGVMAMTNAWVVLMTLRPIMADGGVIEFTFSTWNAVVTGGGFAEYALLIDGVQSSTLAHVTVTPGMPVMGRCRTIAAVGQHTFTLCGAKNAATTATIDTPMFSARRVR